MKELKLKPQVKRGILLLAVIVFVGAAAWLNWSYNQRWGEADSAMVRAEDSMDVDAVDAILGTGRNDAEAASAGGNSDYFAKARLTRQQSRDQALSLLETAAGSQSASREVIDSAMSEISAMASWTMQECKIENELLAKDFEECAFYVRRDTKLPYAIKMLKAHMKDGIKATKVLYFPDKSGIVLIEFVDGFSGKPESMSFQCFNPTRKIPYHVEFALLANATYKGIEDGKSKLPNGLRVNEAIDLMDFL